MKIPDSTAPIRVLIVDDHDMVRIGLRVSIETTNGLSVVGEANNGKDAIRLYSELQPDVVLMDLLMPGINGIVATHEIRKQYPEARIIVLTSYDDEDLIYQAIRAGAMSFILKHTTVTELCKAVYKASRGESTLSQEAIKALIAVKNRPRFSATNLQIVNSLFCVWLRVAGVMVKLLNIW